MICPYCGSLQTEEQDEGKYYCTECYEFFDDNYSDIKE